MTFKPEILSNKLIFSYEYYKDYVWYVEQDCIFDISKWVKIVEERWVRWWHISWYIEANWKKESFWRKNKDLMNYILELFKDRWDLEYIIIPNVPNPWF